jgi:hypothetical protein
LTSKTDSAANIHVLIAKPKEPEGEAAYQAQDEKVWGADDALGSGVHLAQ